MSQHVAQSKSIHDRYGVIDRYMPVCYMIKIFCRNFVHLFLGTQRGILQMDEIGAVTKLHI